MRRIVMFSAVLVTAIVLFSAVLVTAIVLFSAVLVTGIVMIKLAHVVFTDFNVVEFTLYLLLCITV